MNKQYSMGVLEAIQIRRSVRRYLNKPIEADKMAALIEAARLAPSASNRQEWRFVIVEDPETKNKIVEMAGNQRFLSTAATIIVACADRDDHIMPCGQLSYPIDVAIALEHIALAAVELGLGTCWIGDFDEGKVKQLLGIPEKIRIVELMSLGYPANVPTGEKRRLPPERIVKYERW